MHEYTRVECLNFYELFKRWIGESISNYCAPIMTWGLVSRQMSLAGATDVVERRRGRYQRWRHQLLPTPNISHDKKL